MKFVVNMELWRESFSGRDYFDSNITKTVNARNEDFAKRKAKKLVEKDYKNSSQSLWIKDARTTVPKFGGKAESQ